MNMLIATTTEADWINEQRFANFDHEPNMYYLSELKIRRFTYQFCMKK
jgi:hypothetical protein